jgi:hypothetical protein
MCLKVGLARHDDFWFECGRPPPPRRFLGTHLPHQSSGRRWHCQAQREANYVTEQRCFYESSTLGQWSIGGSEVHGE